jgi:hypothetical protein
VTGSEPDALMAIVDGEVPGSDTAGCRLIVASFEAAAPLVSSATADAARRIMMAPALGDFMELRFVDIGPRPGPSDNRTEAAQLILEELLSLGDEFGRNYFAIAVADRSAAEVELVLTECVNAPFFNELPMRMHGIASLDDRRSATEIVSGASIAIAASGAWSHSDLVDELRQHANDLLGQFAAGQQGLSQGELDSVRARYEQHVMLGHGKEPSEDPGAAAPDELPAEPAPAAQPDILASESPEPDAPAEAAPAGASTAEAARAEVAPAGAAPAKASTAEASTAEASTAEAGTADANATEPGTAEPSPAPDLPASAPAPSLVRLPRWLHDPPWRRGRQPESAAATQAEAPRISGLVYLLITGDEIAGDPVSWQRSRAALLKLDAKIATIPQAAYQLRALQGDAEALRGELRGAGQVAKKDVRHPVADTDFAAVLEEMLALLRRDLTRTTAAGDPPMRTVVVFFALDPPLADSVTADVFSHLAGRAMVIWVVPKEAIALLSGSFTQPPNVHVLPEHEDVADEIAGLLTPPDSTAVTPADTSATEDGDA